MWNGRYRKNRGPADYLDGLCPPDDEVDARKRQEDIPMIHMSGFGEHSM